MIDFMVEIVVQAAPEPNRVESTFAAIADAFFDLDDVNDQDLSSDDETLTFSMSLSADDEIAALSEAMTAVRTAIHAAGGATPGWESHIETLRTVIEREQNETLTTV